jgi:transaldolase
MVRRLDDWLNVLVKRTRSPPIRPTNPVGRRGGCEKGVPDFPGARLRRGLSAAYRHHLHWSEFIGGDVIVSMPYEWQKLFNASDVEIKSRIDDPVDPEIVDTLYRHFPDFRRAYDEDGMTVAEFDTYGATVRTLRGFIASIYDLTALIRDEFMLPNPDVR